MDRFFRAIRRTIWVSLWVVSTSWVGLTVSITPSFLTLRGRSRGVHERGVGESFAIEFTFFSPDSFWRPFVGQQHKLKSDFTGFSWVWNNGLPKFLRLYSCVFYFPFYLLPSFVLFPSVFLFSVLWRPYPVTLWRTGLWSMQTYVESKRRVKRSLVPFLPL